ITSVPPTRGAFNTPYVYTVRATDPEGDPVTFSLPTAPTGMAIDSQTGFIQWTPSTTQSGNQNVVIHADDGQGGITEQSWTVVVSDSAENRPPVITSTPPFFAIIGQLYSYGATASDPDGDTLKFLLLTAPAGMSINENTGVIQW